MKPLPSQNFPEIEVRDYFDVQTSSAVAVIGINSRPDIAFQVGNRDDIRNVELFEINGPGFVEELADFLAEEELLSRVSIEDPEQGWDILFLSKEGENICAGFEFGWVYVTELYENNTLEDLSSVFHISVAPAPYEEDPDVEEGIDDDDLEPLEKVPFADLDRDTQRALFKVAFIQEFRNGETAGIGAFFEDRSHAFFPSGNDGSLLQQPLDF